MLTREQFDAETRPLKSALESRRKKFLFYYYTAIPLALGLVATAFFIPETILHAIQLPLKTRPPVTASDIVAYQIFSVLFGCFFVLGPVLGYRGERSISFEKAISRCLMELFNFTLVTQGGLAPREICVDSFTAPLQAYPLSEEGAIGEMNHMRVKLSMGALIAQENGAYTAVFRGLIIICDNQQESAFTFSHLNEMHSPENILKQLSLYLQRALVTHYWDEKLSQMLSHVYEYIKGKTVARLGRNELAAEKTYRLKQEMLAQAARDNNAISLFAENYWCKTPDSRRLALVQGQSPFFRLGSLFVPIEENSRIDRLYDIMTSIDDLTRHFYAETIRKNAAI